MAWLHTELRDEMRSFKIGGIALLLFAGSAAWAQEPVATVGIQNANVTGALEVSNGRALLVGNATVTARDHMADITLSRGGSVHVCATSGLHVTAGKGAAATAPLMLALDRGAVEVQMNGTTSDMVMTPDLRFTLAADGPMDLRLRVTKNGDTCVENRGGQAPVLHIADQFGGASYDLRAGQHVLFEHGDLREVVDRESSDCGCPPEPTPTEQTMTVADALIHPGATGSGDSTPTAKTAAEEHPFPAAVSAGLAPTAPTPPSPAGELHMQVAATLSSNGGPDSTTPAQPADSSGSTSKAATQASGTTASTPQAAPAATPAAPESKGLFHAMGRFFQRIFGAG